MLTKSRQTLLVGVSIQALGIAFINQMAESEWHHVNNELIKRMAAVDKRDSMYTQKTVAGLS